MGKLIVIRLGEGSFKIGFPVFLRIAEDGKPYHNELDARLPPDPELDSFYENLKKHGFQANLKDKYKPLNAKKLLNNWLSSSQFLEKWHELKTDCTSKDIIRVILQTSDSDLAKLPWHLWNLFENYPLAEMAFSLSEYKLKPYYSTRTEVRILAIMGNSQGIDYTVDERELKLLCPNTCFLPEKDQETIFRELRDEKSWDILFFAGHSKTTDGQGILSINQTDQVKIEDLENAVKQAVSKGLRLAIFNSCDGLGLAKTLASWNVPQVIVMRTPIPDEVAHKFLKFFLEAFVKNEKILYLALRQARENLQGLEGQYPLASWLPVMYDQCFAVEASPTWKQLRQTTAEETKTLTNLPQSQQPHDRLHQALQRLNYTHQVKFFRTFVEQHPIGAYLIHGEEDSGQKWLLNRLMKQVPHWTNAKVISVTINRRSRATYTKALWQELGGRVGLINQPSQTQIIDKVAQLCQNRTVVLIFDRLDEMPEECISQFMGKFWLPLVKSVSGATQLPSRLLMFLIDHSGCVEDWNLDFAETLYPSWEPHIPVKLPKITRLSENDLQSWIENSIDELPLKLTNQVEEIVRDILESSEGNVLESSEGNVLESSEGNVLESSEGNVLESSEGNVLESSEGNVLESRKGGLPQLALEKICNLCDCNWYDWEKVWLKY